MLNSLESTVHFTYATQLNGYSICLDLPLPPHRSILTMLLPSDSAFTRVSQMGSAILVGMDHLTDLLGSSFETNFAEW